MFVFGPALMDADWSVAAWSSRSIQSSRADGVLKLCDASVDGNTDGDDGLDGFVLGVVGREAEGLPNLKITTFQSKKNQHIIKIQQRKEQSR
jgi:hypothetical protein